VSSNPSKGRFGLAPEPHEEASASPPARRVGLEQEFFLVDATGETSDLGYAFPPLVLQPRDAASRTLERRGP
jgi:hypothetical protein